ncbi:hypothetical protein [Photorhabdus temperata]|uniref:hypothetical protein n=1 Tax=Photorhabdus temperata TaxID=574560 RepID=UPI001FB05133|nr:hypothetical protein [Photorhabdus temperata]
MKKTAAFAAITLLSFSSFLPVYAQDTLVQLKQSSPTPPRLSHLYPNIQRGADTGALH